MPSSFTSRARLELQAAGEGLNTWGDPKLNNDFKRVDFAVKGVVSLALSGSVSLTSSNTSTDPAQYQAIAAVLNITSGTGGTITAPSVEGTWLVRNGSSGPVSITTGSGATAIIASGDTASVLCDATNVYREKQTDIANQRLTNLANPVSAQDAVTKTYADNLAFSASLPAQAGNAGKFLTTNGTTANWSALYAYTPLNKAGDTMTGALGIVQGSTSILLDQGGVELYRSDGLPFIDFKNAPGDDFDVRIQQSGANGLYISASGGVSINGASVFTSANFNPALKADLSGANFTGVVRLTDADYYIGVSSGQPYINFDPNDFIQYDRSINRGRFVIGGTELASWQPSGFAFNIRPSFAGQTPYDTGNLTYGTAAPGTLPVGAVYLRHG